MKIIDVILLEKWIEENKYPKHKEICTNYAEYDGRKVDYPKLLKFIRDNSKEVKVIKSNQTAHVKCELAICEFGCNRSTCDDCDIDSIQIVKKQEVSR